MFVAQGVEILAEVDCTRADIGKKYGVIELHTDFFKSLLLNVESEVRFTRVEHRWLGSVIETVHASFVKSPALPTTALLSVPCAQSHCCFLSVHLSSPVVLDDSPFFAVDFCARVVVDGGVVPRDFDRFGVGCALRLVLGRSARGVFVCHVGRNRGIGAVE